MTADGLDVTREGGVLTLRFDRPDALNAVTGPLLAAAVDLLSAAAADPDVRVVVMTGAGRAFSAGADIGGEFDPDRGTATLDGANALVRAIVDLPKPVIAAVNGPAAGVGATIALAADLVVARRSAYFLLAFVNIGLMPDGGATAILPAAIGRARAARMALLGERVSAETAFEWGLASHVVDDDDLDAQVAALASRLSTGPTRAYAETKAALRSATLAHLGAAHAEERAGQRRLFETSDFAEGVAAFNERRAARFTGR